VAADIPTLVQTVTAIVRHMPPVCPTRQVFTYVKMRAKDFNADRMLFVLHVIMRRNAAVPTISEENPILWVDVLESQDCVLRIQIVVTVRRVLTASADLFALLTPNALQARDVLTTFASKHVLYTTVVHRMRPAFQRVIAILAVETILNVMANTHAFKIVVKIRVKLRVFVDLMLFVR
jgi:hypothetical protein